MAGLTSGCTGAGAHACSSFIQRACAGPVNLALGRLPSLLHREVNAMYRRVPHALLVCLLCVPVACTQTNATHEHPQAAPVASATAERPPDGTGEPDIGATVLTFIELSRQHRVAAHRLLSERLLASVENGGPAAAELVGWNDPTGRVDARVVSVATQRGAAARSDVEIEYTWAGGPLRESYVLVRDGDGWYIDQIWLGDKLMVGQEYVPGTRVPTGTLQPPRTPRPN